jgi:hypothetical protein
MGNHEWRFYCWHEGAAHVFFVPNNETDVWSIKKINPRGMIHLTEKSIKLAVRIMQYSSRRLPPRFPKSLRPHNLTALHLLITQLLAGMAN